MVRYENPHLFFWRAGVLPATVIWSVIRNIGNDRTASPIAQPRIQTRAS